MKTSGRCFVGIENKSGGVWQVELDESGQAMVLHLIEQIHGGAVKVIRNGKLPIIIPKQNEK